MDYLKLKEMRMKKIKQLLEKKDPAQLRFLLSLEKGKRPINPKRKPHKIKITGPKRVTSKSKPSKSKPSKSKPARISKNRISKNRTSKSKPARISKNSKPSKRKMKTMNPLLK